MAVVKANAYGHGDVEVSKALNRAGVYSFAVATITEGIDLRKHGVEGDILVLGYTNPKDISSLVHYHLIQTVVDSTYAETLNRYGKKIKVHIKLDTGMHRLGEMFDNIPNIKRIYGCKNLIIGGTYSHLCVADSLNPSDIEFSRYQIDCFYQTIKCMDDLGLDPGKIHIQSSYGVLNYPELQCDYARIGIALYGVLSSKDDKTKLSVDLRPVLSLKARIVTIKQIAIGETVGYGRQFTADRDTKIAVVSIGYADGLPRNLSCGRGAVLINGEYAPIIGRVCMDQLMVDITHIKNVEQGDVVTIIGQDGRGRISAEQIAKESGTITNELLSRLGNRLERIYSR